MVPGPGPSELPTTRETSCGFHDCSEGWLAWIIPKLPNLRFKGEAIWSEQVSALEFKSQFAYILGFLLCRKGGNNIKAAVRKK